MATVLCKISIGCVRMKKLRIEHRRRPLRALALAQSRVSVYPVIDNACS